MQQYQPKRIYLSDLTLKPIRDTICVRVMRKWIYDGNNPGAPIIYIGMVLADEKGEAIYAQILRSDVPRLDPLLQEAGTYIISKFSVKVSKTGYVPLDKEFMINFTSFSVIVPVSNPPLGFPAFIYKITPFSNINPIGPAASKPIDVLGIITMVHSTQPMPLKQKERTATVRDVIIKDLSGTDLKVRLWDERATQFTLPSTSAAEPAHSIVVLFVGCLPKSISNVTQVNGGNACRWYFNPNIREAQPLYDRLKLSPVPVHQAPPLLTGAANTTTPIIHEHKTLADLKKIDPFDFPDDGYKCTVTVIGVSETNKWFYTGCAKCKKAPEVETVPFLCTNGTCNYRETTTLYKLAFRARDDTDDADFFAYDYASRRLIKKNIGFVIRQYNKDGSQLPQAITNVISKKFTLLVKPTRGSYDDINNRVYEVTGVSVDFEEQAFIERQLLLTQGSNQTMPTAALPAPINETPEPASEIATTVAALTPPPSLALDNTPNRTSGDTSFDKGKFAPKVLFPPTPSANETVQETTSSLPAESSVILHETTRQRIRTPEPTVQGTIPVIESPELQRNKEANLDDHTQHSQDTEDEVPDQNNNKRPRRSTSADQIRDTTRKSASMKSRK